MLQKFVTIPETDEHKKKYGDFNSPPPNMVEITVEEFSQSPFFIYCPTVMEFRQIIPDRLPWKGEKYYLAIRLYFMPDGNGYGMSHDYHGQKIRYFRFTVCDHSETEPHGPQFRSQHTSKCKKCGYVNSVDSSD